MRVVEVAKVQSAQLGGVPRECGKYECCSELQENTNGAEGAWSCELCKRGFAKLEQWKPNCSNVTMCLRANDSSNICTCLLKAN